MQRNLLLKRYLAKRTQIMLEAKSKMKKAYDDYLYDQQRLTLKLIDNGYM